MQLEVGSIYEGKVTGITKFGAFVELENGKTGMVHISEVASVYVKEIKDHLQLNQTVKVKVLTIGEDGKVSLSIKQCEPPKPKPQRSHQGRTFEGLPRSAEPTNFEDMLTKFKQSSDERMSDLKRNVDSKRGSYSRRGH
ncbi:MAG: S1 RNA-binding domain-containing protein [Oscillospiraceae bacterium]|nr:S1 RNA-binding domain-containing protein [Oscillospiraceae bacterium]MBQ8731743.1 S1 RNA-binding domain-containing protein [Oscillospiraceae bacterium]